jgi:lipopolysaccharide heptosyltransferase II
MQPLQIYDRRERALVAAADRVLGLGAAILRPFASRRAPAAPRRILLLRLERIGDLLMALPAFADVRARAPNAAIDLIVGSWNADLARAIPGVANVHTLDASWLARGHSGVGLPSLIRTARGWRGRHYDLAINFEPDVRSNLLAALSGAAWTAGYRSGGGGALLDVALDYDARAHTTDNARRLVAAVLPLARQQSDSDSARPLMIPAAAQDQARQLLGRSAPGSTLPHRGTSAADRAPLVGVHVSGGRAIKQWEPDRFGEVAQRLIDATGATIVLTGSADDRALVTRVREMLPPQHTIDVAGHLDLLTLAAILADLDLLITGDTGPMHLAAAVATPVVAVFGPSDPVRYAPRGRLDCVVRVDLPCSPCNRIRLPPARCTGHTPDCLTSVSADRVFAAATAVLQELGRRALVRVDTPTA